MSTKPSRPWLSSALDHSASLPTVIGRNVRHDRQLACLSIRELARNAQVAPSTIVAIEQGKRRPHPATLRKIASQLAVDPSELLTPSSLAT